MIKTENVVNSINIDPIVMRLDVLIRLILDQQIAEKKIKRKDQFLSMVSVGLTTGEIASILGKPSKDISSQIKRAKKESSKVRNDLNENE